MTNDEIKAVILRKLESGPLKTFGRKDFPVNNRAARLAFALADLIQEGKVVKVREDVTGEAMFKLRPGNPTPAEIADAILQAVADATDLIWWHGFDPASNLWTVTTDGASLVQLVTVHEALNNFFNFLPPFQPIHWTVDSGWGWTLWKSVQGQVRLRSSDTIMMVEVKVNV